MPSPVAEIDAMLRERHLLKHPFYVAWASGEVPMSTLRSYAEQYYQFESNFPRFLGAAYSHLANPADRRVLLENMVDEEGRSPTHPELWLDFAAGLGVSEDRVRRARPLGATEALLACYDRLTRRSGETGVAALYAYESIFPEVAAEKSRGLRAHYGIRAAKSHEFFRVHTEADVAHSRAEAGILTSLADRSPAARRAALAASRQSIGAWWAFLDAFPVRGAPPASRK